MTTCPVCCKYVDPTARPRCERIHVGVDDRVCILPFHYRCELRLIEAEKAGKPLVLRLE